MHVQHIERRKVQVHGSFSFPTAEVLIYKWDRGRLAPPAQQGFLYLARQVVPSAGELVGMRYVALWLIPILFDYCSIFRQAPPACPRVVPRCAPMHEPGVRSWLGSHAHNLLRLL